MVHIATATPVYGDTLTHRRLLRRPLPPLPREEADKANIRRDIEITTLTLALRHTLRCYVIG